MTTWARPRRFAGERRIPRNRADPPPQVGLCEGIPLCSCKPSRSAAHVLSAGCPQQDRTASPSTWLSSSTNSRRRPHWRPPTAGFDSPCTQAMPTSLCRRPADPFGDRHQSASERLQVHGPSNGRQPARHCQRGSGNHRDRGRMRRPRGRERRGVVSAFRTTECGSDGPRSRTRVQPMGRRSERRPDLNAQSPRTRVRVRRRPAAGANAHSRDGVTRATCGHPRVSFVRMTFSAPSLAACSNVSYACMMSSSAKRCVTSFRG